MLEEKNDNLHEADGINSENDKNTIVNQINDGNAEDSEDTSIEEQRELPPIDYENRSLDELTAQLESLLKNHKIMAIREHAEAIKRAFYQQYNELLDEKRTLFLEENPDAFASDFQYEIPVKNTFDTLLEEYRVKRNSHYKSLQDQLKKNLNERNQIIEELKELVDNTEN
ncbi:MAG TPA: DUF349 domain-containing protein, partial [Flavobacterium sp.]|nr:DUF349 domain-containing protein [Flavobacterium sp.]